MFERFTDEARRVLVLAQEESRVLGHDFIGTEHLLLGILRHGQGPAPEALTTMGVTLEAARAQIAQTVGPRGTAAGGSIPFTPRAKKTLELALREALQLGHDHIRTEHLLLGVIDEGDGVGARTLVALDVDLSRLRDDVTSRVRRAGGALELGAVQAAADVGRAEVEALSGRVDADRVEIAAAERLHAHDALVPRGQELLHERGVVEPQVERAVTSHCLQRLERVEAAHAGAAAADVRLHDDGEAQPLRRRGRLARLVDDARAREREPERVEQRQLARLGDLGQERARAVHHAHALALELVQVLRRVEDAVADTAPPRRRAHAVEEQ